MTQEERMLLIKDLSARLPYAVTVEHTSGFRGTLHDLVIHHIYDDNDNVYDAICYTDFFGDEDDIYIEYFKPYLFPLSSMTEEQKEEIEDKLIFPSNSNGGWIEILYNDIYNIPFWFVDFCNKNHFDYHGLIEKGLAIDATNLNIY